MNFAVLGMLTAASLADVHYVDASLELEDDILAWSLVDVDADGVDELCLAVHTATGREVRVHDIEAQRITAEPRFTVSVLDDVLAFTFADVRDDPGRELVFLTRTGAWSYSPVIEGLRGNIARLVTRELLYDVPNPKALPFWDYVLPSLPGGEFERLLLPERRGFSVWVPGAEATGDAEDQPLPYVQAGFYSERVGGFRPDREDGRPPETEEDGPLFEVDGAIDAEVLLSEDGTSSNLLANGRSFAAPAVLDLDGDGIFDMLRRKGTKLHVYLGTAVGLPAEPTRIEKFPDYLRRDDEELELRLIDVDRDGDVDLMARWSAESDGLENSKVTLQLLENDGERMLPEQPTQLLRFEAAVLRANVADVDGDGALDLVVRKFEMPGLMDAVTGLEFKATHLLFPGVVGDKPQFTRRAALKQTEIYDEETFLGAVANRSLKLDCDGDGIADLVEIDVHGRVAIRRLAKRTSRMRGSTWSLDERPWKRFEVHGDISSLVVRDLNGDGLGDVVSRSERVLTVLLSVGKDKQ